MPKPETSNIPSGKSLPVLLRELSRSIAKLPEPDRRRLTRLTNEIEEQSRRQRENVQMVQEALTQMRLDLQYLMFDLECTRMERDHLRRQLQ